MSKAKPKYGYDPDSATPEVGHDRSFEYAGLKKSLKFTLDTQSFTNLMAAEISVKTLMYASEDDLLKFGLSRPVAKSFMEEFLRPVRLDGAFEKWVTKEVIAGMSVDEVLDHLDIVLGAALSLETKESLRKNLVCGATLVYVKQSKVWLHNFIGCSEEDANRIGNYVEDVLQRPSTPVVPLRFFVGMTPEGMNGFWNQYFYEPASKNTSNIILNGEIGGTAFYEWSDKQFLRAGFSPNAVFVLREYGKRSHNSLDQVELPNHYQFDNMTPEELVNVLCQRVRPAPSKDIKAILLDRKVNGRDFVRALSAGDLVRWGVPGGLSLLIMRVKMSLLAFAPPKNSVPLPPPTPAEIGASIDGHDFPMFLRKILTQYTLQKHTDKVLAAMAAANKTSLSLVPVDLVRQSLSPQDAHVICNLLRAEYVRVLSSTMSDIVVTSQPHLRTPPKSTARHDWHRVEYEQAQSQEFLNYLYARDKVNEKIETGSSQMADIVVNAAQYGIEAYENDVLVDPEDGGDYAGKPHRSHERSVDMVVFNLFHLFDAMLSQTNPEESTSAADDQ